MPAIRQKDGEVVVRFAPGDDDAVFSRVRGWVYWQQMHISYVRGEDHETWRIAGMELVAPAWAYETVVEIISGQLRPALARHEGSGSRVYRQPGP